MDLSKRIGGMYPASWLAFIIIFATLFILPEDQWLGFIIGFLTGTIIYVGQIVLILRAREKK